MRNYSPKHLKIIFNFNWFWGLPKKKHFLFYLSTYFTDDMMSRHMTFSILRIVDTYISFCSYNVASHFAKERTLIGYTPIQNKTAFMLLLTAKNEFCLWQLSLYIPVFVFFHLVVKYLLCGWWWIRCVFMGQCRFLISIEMICFTLIPLRTHFLDLL